MAKEGKPGSGLSVLIVDDEPGIRDMCRGYLEGLGCKVEEAENIERGRAALANGAFGLAIFDVRLPDGSGLGLFRSARKQWPDLPIAIITGYASVEDAIDAVKAGAIDYITKPFDVARLKEVVELATARMPAGHEDLPKGTFNYHGIIAASTPMRSVCQLIERAAQTPSTVLVQGESGTGKELVAKAIHEAGPNAAEPFVPVDCSSMPEGLIESELFGHVKGAFTGAHTDKTGLFPSARKGTVFLDEIGELPQPLQAKLLRTLQEREVRPVGATAAVPFRARMIVATNRDLRSAMADGEFRRDLFFRLHVIPVYLPPLRSRRADIAPLATHFLNQLNAAAGRKCTFSRGAVELLAPRDWPGNVRELQNAIEHAFALAADDHIGGDAFADADSAPAPPRHGDRLEDYERQAIKAALQKTGGNREEAARILHIGVATLFRKLKKYELK